jgi:hypothetical protein
MANLRVPPTSSTSDSVPEMQTGPADNELLFAARAVFQVEVPGRNANDAPVSLAGHVLLLLAVGLPTVLLVLLFSVTGCASTADRTRDLY